jgi:hypothetical protein
MAIIVDFLVLLFLNFVYLIPSLITCVVCLLKNVHMKSLEVNQKIEYFIMVSMWSNHMIWREIFLVPTYQINLPWVTTKIVAMALEQCNWTCYYG